MDRLEALRIALEAGVISLLGIVVLFLATGPSRRYATVVYLVAICAGLAIQILLNALASTGILADFRIVNFFIDLVIGPLMLGFVSRIGKEGAFLERQDLWHLLWPVAGLVVLLSNMVWLADLLVCGSQATYLALSIVTLVRRRNEMQTLRVLGLSAALITAFGVALSLRIWIVVDVATLSSYRQSVAYIGILTLFFAMSVLLLWTALRHSERLLWRPRTDDLPTANVDEIEQNLRTLIENDKLFLDADLSLAEVAKRLEVLPRHVSKVVGARMKTNFSGYINHERAQEAGRLLRSKVNLPITTIIYESGFGSKSAFQREFRREFGLSPSAYRKQHRRTE